MLYKDKDISSIMAVVRCKNITLPSICSQSGMNGKMDSDVFVYGLNSTIAYILKEDYDCVDFIDPYWDLSAIYDIASKLKLNMPAYEVMDAEFNMEGYLEITLGRIIIGSNTNERG